MFLHNSPYNKRAKFVYSLDWDDQNYAFIFSISEAVANLFESKIIPENLYLRYVREKIGIKDFETNIFKNFGCPETSQNLGIKNGILQISFPVGKGVTILESQCPICKGKGLRYERTCGFCHGTKKHIQRNVSLNGVVISISTLFSFLNLFVGNLEIQDELIGEKKFQHLYLEIAVPYEPGRTYGLGSNISQELRDGFKLLPDNTAKEIAETMYQCSLAIDGFVQYPEWERSHREFEFRCKVDRKDAVFYLEVPGVNGCSFYLMRQGSVCGPNSLSCHNVDSSYQTTLLFVGFAKLCSLITQKNSAS